MNTRICNKNWERSCHSCVCISVSGRELASISMLHTHNYGNSFPFFCQKCYPICETIIFKPLWVTFFVNFSLSRLQVSKSWMQKLKFRYVQICTYFFIFFGSPSDDLSLGCNPEPKKKKINSIFLEIQLKILLMNIKIWKNKNWN